MFKTLKDWLFQIKDIKNSIWIKNVNPKENFKWLILKPSFKLII